MTRVFKSAVHMYHTEKGIYISSTELREIPRCITKRDVYITKRYSRTTRVFTSALHMYHTERGAYISLWGGYDYQAP